MCDLVKNILQAYLFDAVGSEAQKNSSAVLSWTHSLSSRSSSARRLIETFPEAEFENLSELRGLSLELNSARGVASRPFPPRSMRIWLEGEFLEELQIFVHEGEPVEIQGYTLKPGGTLNPSTASEASLLSARKWLDDCLASHLKCGSAQAARLPKRVLDISNNKIRLYEPSSVDETGRYVCLSYCWGPPPWFRTTPDTKPDRLKNIPWEHLPKTFQDVVSVTRQLGIQFLWIDALCIIQDDEADWEEQSSQMASIYEHCHLTICADRSPDVHSGIFSAETEPHHELAVTRDGDHKTVPAFVRVPVRHMITSDKDSTRERLFPLETRAWAYHARCGGAGGGVCAGWRRVCGCTGWECGVCLLAAQGAGGASRVGARDVGAGEAGEPDGGAVVQARWVRRGRGAESGRAARRTTAGEEAGCGGSGGCGEVGQVRFSVGWGAGYED